MSGFPVSGPAEAQRLLRLLGASNSREVDHPAKQLHAQARCSPAGVIPRLLLASFSISGQLGAVPGLVHTCPDVANCRVVKGPVHAFPCQLSRQGQHPGHQHQPPGIPAVGAGQQHPTVPTAPGFMEGLLHRQGFSGWGHAMNGFFMDREEGPAEGGIIRAWCPTSASKGLRFIEV